MKHYQTNTIFITFIYLVLKQRIRRVLHPLSLRTKYVLQQVISYRFSSTAVWRFVDKIIRHNNVHVRDSWSFRRVNCRHLVTCVRVCFYRKCKLKKNLERLLCCLFGYSSNDMFWTTFRLFETCRTNDQRFRVATSFRKTSSDRPSEKMQSSNPLLLFLIVLSGHLYIGFCSQIVTRFEYKFSFKPPYLAQKDGSVPFWEYGGSMSISPVILYTYALILMVFSTIIIIRNMYNMRFCILCIYLFVI